MKKLNVVIALSLLTLSSTRVLDANDLPLDEEPAFEANIYSMVQSIPADYELSYDDLVKVVEVVEEEVTEEPQQQLNWMMPCSTSNVKTYMDYKAITMVGSKQYQYIQNNMTISNGLLYDGDYIGVALGSWWGDIGSKWTIELDTGILLNVVKVDEKANAHTYSGCQHRNDSSVIEFVIDSNTVPSEWWGGNGLVFNGNFNNSELFNGNILRVSRGG